MIVTRLVRPAVLGLFVVLLLPPARADQDRVTRANYKLANQFNKAYVRQFVYDTTVVHLSAARGTCALGRLAEPRIEPEIVLHFRSAPPVTNDPTELLACIDWIAHGIEIVQSHFPGWTFRAADTVADWALHGTLLVGEPQSIERIGPDLVSQLERFTISLADDGQILVDKSRKFQEEKKEWVLPGAFLKI